MSDNAVSLSEWWFNKRLQYNKGLLFTGLLGFLVLTLQQTLNSSKNTEELIQKMQVAGVGLLIFLLLANIAFGLGFVIDYMFNHKNSQSFREWLFFIGYGFAVIILIFCIIFFLMLT